MAERRKRSRSGGAWSLLAAVAIAAGGGCGSCDDGASDEIEARANVALSQLSRCLLGEPLGAGERPSARLRNVQLGAQGTSATRGWPERCALYAGRMADELDERDRYREAYRAARTTERALEQGRTPADLDTLFDTSLALGLVAVPSTEGDAAPTPARPLRAQDVPALVPSPGILAASDPVIGPVTHLAFSVPNGPWRICTLTHDLGAATCRGLAALSGRGEAAIVSSAPAAPAHVQIKRGGEPGIYAVESGSRVYDGTPGGAFARRDGTLAVLDGGDLVQVRDVAVRTAIGAPRDERVAMIWDRILWLAPARAEEPRPFMVTRVPVGIAPPDPAEQIGVGPVTPRSDELVMAACRSENALAMVVRSAHDHEKDQPTTVAILTDGGEQVTLQTTTDIYGPELTCRGETATITWLLTEPTGIAIHQRLCDLRECRRAVVSLPFRGSDPYVGRIGENTLLTWKSPLGDTRIRIAPLADLPNAPDVVVLDDGAHGGLDVLSRRIFFRGDHALLVLRARAGGHVIRIGADGSYTAVRPSRP
jgi:hypothetical protein